MAGRQPRDAILRHGCGADATGPVQPRLTTALRGYRGSRAVRHVDLGGPETRLSNHLPMPPTPPPLTLVILAAGRSTRFGRLKQLTPIGPSGEALLDYALHDGALAGFTRFVLVIQEDKQADFDAHLSPAVAAGLDIGYVYQSLSHPGLVDTPPPGRTRPWGTGHAILTAAEQIDGPFAMCNADDFYGRGAYATLAGAMGDATPHEASATPESTAAGPAPSDAPASASDAPTSASDAPTSDTTTPTSDTTAPASDTTAPASDPTPTPPQTVGYPIEITLSDSGGVSRGICEVDEMGALQKLTEGLQMRRAGNRVRGHDVAERPLDVPLDALVCTNLWGFPRDRFTPESGTESVTDIVSHLRDLFSEFLAATPGTDSEYYLSEAMNVLIARGLVHCRVLPTRETWLGVTFPGDHPRVAESLSGLVDSKVYPRSLWGSSPATPSHD